MDLTGTLCTGEILTGRMRASTGILLYNLGEGQGDRVSDFVALLA
jgi:hypothetical protein